MPSLQHAVVSRLIGLLRPRPPLDDLDALRTRLTEENRVVHEGPPRGVRAGRQQRVETDHGFPVVTLWRPDVDSEMPRRAVFYLHGGAYIRPTDRRHWELATRLADALGARTVVPLYPLAPEFTVEDSFAAMADLFEEIAEECPDGVALVGDSAGGGYALALAQELRDRARSRARSRGESKTCATPDRIVLISPWVDLSGSVPGTLEAAEDDPWLSFPHLAVYAGFWAGSDDAAALAAPRVSPLRGDLSGLAPTLMFCGTRDLLKPGCDALFELADTVGWELEYVVAPGLVHVYPLLPIPEARDAVDAMIAFARSG